MSGPCIFYRPRFTARTVANAIGEALCCELAFQEAGVSDNTDGNVDVTSRVHVQVGTDFLVVAAWIDPKTLRSWPPRPNIPRALRDLREAMREFPEVDE